MVSCANYAWRIREPRSLIEAGQYDKAIEKLKVLAEKKDNDELLFLMDLGIAYHRARRYGEAVETFLKADRLAEIKDYTSLTQESVSVLLSDEVKPYKGEDFEKILINVYLAIDYTLAGRWEDALVECRRVNHKLDLMISQGQLPYERNAFAKYLAGSLFESQGEFNDAFVDYRQLLKWKGDMPFLDVALLRLADKLKAEQEFGEYRKRYPATKEFRLGKNYGEVVLILEQGQVPIKVPNPAFNRIPQFQRRYYPSEHVKLRDSKNLRVVDSFPYFDIEETAIRELDNRMAAIIAKKVGGIVLKEVVAHQIEKKNELLGALTRVFLHATDQADLRSWSTLPARLHIARLMLPAGRHDIVLDMVGQSGDVSSGVTRWDGVEIKPGKITFLNYRTVD